MVMNDFIHNDVVQHECAIIDFWYRQFIIVIIIYYDVQSLYFLQKTRLLRFILFFEIHLVQSISTIISVHLSQSGNFLNRPYFVVHPENIKLQIRAKFKFLPICFQNLFFIIFYSKQLMWLWLFKFQILSIWLIKAEIIQKIFADVSPFEFGFFFLAIIIIIFRYSRF